MDSFPPTSPRVPLPFSPISKLAELEVLEIFDFLDVRSLLRCGATSKLFHILCSDSAGRNSSVVSKTLSSYLLIPSLISSLQSAPTCAVILGANHSAADAKDLRKAVANLPPNTHVLFAETFTVQSATSYFGDEAKSKPKSKSTKKLKSKSSAVTGGGSAAAHTCTGGDGGIMGTGAEDLDEEEEGEPKLSVMMCAYPEATATSFLVETDAMITEDEDGEDVLLPFTDDILTGAGFIDLDADWKVFILCVSADGAFGEALVNGLQCRYPHAAVLGGVTSRGIAVGSPNNWRSVPKSRSNCIGVLAIRGNVPIHCIVSRGVESLSPIYSFPTCNVMTSTETDLRVCLIPLLTSPSGVESSPMAVLQSLRTSGGGVIMGTASSASGPFALDHLASHNLRSQGEVLALYLKPSDAPPTHVSFFTVSPAACERDISQALLIAKERCAAEGKTVMGAVMFSCSARGPEPNPHFFRSEATDATTFRHVFPSTPMLGCYCGGEIGPSAMACANAETIFRTGSAALQGFTAVFGLFVVPPRVKVSVLRRNLTA